MAHDFATSYVEIIKADENPDGTMTVYGKATDDSLDVDNQICDADWLNRAMPDWFKSGGNIREQHSSIAAGVATDYEAKSDGHYISALVVDPNSVKKVKHRVLKGFSIGIKNPRVIRDSKAVNGRIADGTIVEVSLVDRPANPNAKLIMAKSLSGESTLTQVEEFHEYSAPLPTDVFKRDVSQEERERLADRGAAMPDGSYPIANTGDLKNAIQAFGRAKNPAAVKQHIIRRARALGATDLLPEEWKKSMKSANEIVEAAKGMSAEITKYDDDAYTTARAAIAQLIIAEANEMAQGSDERDDIETLLSALKHLFNYKDGEVEEGEAAPDMEMGADADTAKGDDSCDCDCDSCQNNKGCDSKMCKCGNMSAVEVKSADAEETVAETVETPAETVAETVVAETEVSSEEVVAKSEEKTLAGDDLKTIIEEAVKSAIAPIKAEVDSLRAEKESVVEKATKLEEELAIVKSLPATGPKRTAEKPQGIEVNQDLLKATRYYRMADQISDPFLAKGFRDKADSILNKSTEADNSEKE